MAPPNLTERQQKWFASVRAGLERDSGKSVADWVTIARTCPETAHRARLKWFKETHGLLQNRASLILNEAFGTMAWSAPESLIDGLWTDVRSRAVFEAVHGQAIVLPGVTPTARKTYGAWSRNVQFAAMRPARDGCAVLGLAVQADADRRLEPRRGEPWSERLISRLRLTRPSEVDRTVGDLLKAAWASA